MKKVSINHLGYIIAGIVGTILGVAEFFTFIASPNVYIRIAMGVGLVIAIWLVGFKKKRKDHEKRIHQASEKGS